MLSDKGMQKKKEGKKMETHGIEREGERDGGGGGGVERER